MKITDAARILCGTCLAYGLMLQPEENEKRLFITASKITAPGVRDFYLMTPAGGGHTTQSVRLRVVEDTESRQVGGIEELFTARKLEVAHHGATRGGGIQS